ncbi:MAG: CBS domain-containing protein [Anaerolineae bacterium]|nr:CBS domain-containing protein [Anaerolineae bacterium]
MEIILTHDNADFDAIAALLAAYKLNSTALPVLPEQLNQNVARFIALYQNGLPFIRLGDVNPSAVSGITLVDTQRILHLKGLPTATPVHIIDHHPLTHTLKEHHTFTGETVGAVTTLLIEQIRQQGIVLHGLEATLMALGIYEDTGSLSYGTTTARDLVAAAWLLEQQADLDTVRRFLSHPLNEEQQTLFDTLLDNAESHIIQGHTVILCSTTIDQYISEISTVVHHLRNIFDSAALFVLVQMPKRLQLIARATDDAIDVGEIARLFGGGGHNRAAAATIHDKTLTESAERIWAELNQRVQPVTRVANLMSYGVQTVDADQSIQSVVRQLRRIGHEGYPVVDDGAVVGLLTRRDVDRALEHGLGSLPVREIMAAGAITIYPHESVYTLEQRIVETGWGQIPVVDDSNQIIGIVTRTDLIKHWARIHPAGTKTGQIITLDQIKQVLGHSAAQLIQAVAGEAQNRGIKLYLVGGVVRDLLLQRQNLDIDFVVEGQSPQLAARLVKQFGGHHTAFSPFGTAKWKLNTSVAEALKIDPNQMPDHIDFASARNEFYEHPTALPTVYNSSIKLDLQRRDFTINTLAVQLSPEPFYGRILDEYGGLNDLQSGTIRVLHSLSFVDDPTRILRALRFERRLGFRLDPRTAELIASALPMLERITGERLRKELTLLLYEDMPEQGLLNLQERGILAAIHPAFRLDETISSQFRAARGEAMPWLPADIADLYWHILSAHIALEQLENWCERLLFAQNMVQSFHQTAHLIQLAPELSQPSLLPSQITKNLETIPELALLTAWIMIQNDTARERIQRYWLEWKHIYPVTNGHSLRAMNLKPGPCYAQILQRLRVARLDGEIHDDESENRLLQKLVYQERLCDDRA